jgi:hypothetical protein
VLAGSVGSLWGGACARGHSGAPYTWLASVGGLAYLAAVVVQRLCG